MNRRLPTVLLLALVSTSGCLGGSSKQADHREIIDPQGSEFAARRDAMRVQMSGLERLIITYAPGSRFIGPREQVVCLRGNKGPKGTPDEWDSQCGLQRSSVLLIGDPVGVMFKVDSTLRSRGWRGDWYERYGTPPVNPVDVRNGKVLRTAIGRAVYGRADAGLLILQVGRRGDRQLFLREPLGVGYFHDDQGRDWESAIPHGGTVTEPMLAIELTRLPFIRRPETA